MDNHGAMHWRGDRNGAVQQDGVPFLDASGNPVVSAQPDSGIFDEVDAFNRSTSRSRVSSSDATELSDADMSAFTRLRAPD